MESSESDSTATYAKPERRCAALQFVQQRVQQLSFRRRGPQEDEVHTTTNIETCIITPGDAIVQTPDGDRFAVPVAEVERLNGVENQVITENHASPGSSEITSKTHRISSMTQATLPSGYRPGAAAAPPSHIHPLFPPLPTYGPPSLLRTVQCQAYRAVSFGLSLSFLGVVVVSSCVSGIPVGLRNFGMRLCGRDPATQRPFHKEEKERKIARQEAARRWKRRQRKMQQKASETTEDEDCEEEATDNEFPALEGGHDPIICDIAYYARRVGLDVETFKVQTEDGFILTLWHVYNPKEYKPLPDEQRGVRQPNVFYDKNEKPFPSSNRRYPVLLVHGLLQSAGSYCTNDDDSLAFYLCKAGYDVWLGNNRCGFDPQHKTLSYSDPRMWTWNIRHMGVFDLAAFVSRVLYETGFEKLGLVCHSQGTTETFVALAKDQRPELGERISVFCALAPAAYAGPLINKVYFRFVSMLSAPMFRLFFGIHAFIPLMMTMHKRLPSRLYGALGYQVFSYLFNWNDLRWDRGLRDRLFQFAPVYVSAESMRWWLGREGFARHKCVLATWEDGQREEEEDRRHADGQPIGEEERGSKAWYGPQVPPIALWIPGSDDLVDGRRLVRRLQNGREPHVRLVHSKIIDEYEHLDVIWAIDSIEQVGREVLEVIWRTVPDDARAVCRVPGGLPHMDDI
jgi:pimeloyl-ACP methyl ester carboxylesterase